MTFGQDEGQIRGNPIIPICFKTAIDTQRGCNVICHSGATLWRIEVPEEYVAPSIREKIEETRTERGTSSGNSPNSPDKTYYYQLALKQFSKDDSDKFHKERTMSNSLKNADGIVQYFTWYQEGEEEQGGSQISLNLVFELGMMDLYTAILTRAPPVLPGEIKGVWESMLDIICVLRSVDRPSIENIDFNMCHADIKPQNILFVNDRFKLGDLGEATIEVQTASDRPPTHLGGTKTYASPEKNTAVLESNQSWIQKARAKEDIWSLGCVFSVVATWVVLGADGVTQYSRVRQKARHRHINDTSDSFHDDQDVLSEVKAWHRYLRAAARKTDTLSSQVLDLVDRHMLVNLGLRWDANYIAKGFADVLSTEIISDQGFPEEIKALLLEVEMEEIDQERQGPLSEEIPYGIDIPSDGLAVGPLGNADNDSESARELLSRRTMPTIQRLPQQNLPTSHPGCASPGGESLEPDDDEAFTLMNTLLKNIPYSGECDAPTSIFMMEQEIDQLKGGSRRWRLGRSKSVKEHKQAANNDELKDFFNNRDIIFLLDNAPSMAQHWTQVIHHTTVLLERVEEYDDDGIEMYFSHFDRKIEVKQKRRQKIADFVKAMKSAAPTAEYDPSEYSLQRALKRILFDISERIDQKHTTILVLTDGVWAGCNSDGIEIVVKSHMNEKGWDSPEEFEKVQAQMPLSIQFIQFGHDINGTMRLRHLDDDMVQDGYPDLIDTEPAAGDAKKMLLGSLDKTIDHSLNIVNRSSIALPLSPISP
ncbi:Protein kinase domain-containing protein [Apiospora arundinis]